MLSTTRYFIICILWFISIIQCQSSSKSPYDILGIKKSATIDDIKASYRALARKYHPDKNKSPESQTKFLEISSAYEILSDETKRREYDESINTERNHRNFHGFDHTSQEKFHQQHQEYDTFVFRSANGQYFYQKVSRRGSPAFSRNHPHDFFEQYFRDQNAFDEPPSVLFSWIQFGFMIASNFPILFLLIVLWLGFVVLSMITWILSKFMSLFSISSASSSPPPTVSYLPRLRRSFLQETGYVVIALNESTSQFISSQIRSCFRRDRNIFFTEYITSSDDKVSVLVLCRRATKWTQYEEVTRGDVDEKLFTGWIERLLSGEVAMTPAATTPPPVDFSRLL